MSSERSRIVLPYKGKVMAFNLTTEEMSEVLRLAESNPEEYRGAEGVKKALEIIRFRDNPELSNELI